MEIEFYGAAREVTGSCHILRVGGRTVLLDCGMFQGRRAESAAKNRRLPLPIEEIDAIVLSHAHIDHSGRLPFLVQQGYEGTIWATAATRDLCAVMLADSASIQERDAQFLAKKGREHLPPLYRAEDAVNTLRRMVGVPYGMTFDVVPGVRATFTDAGHILGSASVAIDCEENGTRRRVVFSGDVGRAELPILRPPDPPSEAHVVILESTYGNRLHESVADAREELARIVRETAAKGGRILIPAFAVGRTQELIYELHKLHREERIPTIPIYVDSPLAIDATAVFEMHPEIFDREGGLVGEVPNIFEFPLVRYTRPVQESKALNSMRGPMIIIAASGMVESGRILHHLRNGASDPRNTILIVGFQAEHTLGRRIVERRSELKIFGEEVPLRARVEILDGYSAHADRTELTEWLAAVRRRSPELRQVYLVHGEPEPQDAFVEQLTSEGYSVSAPSPGERERIA